MKLCRNEQHSTPKTAPPPGHPVQSDRDPELPFSSRHLRRSLDKIHTRFTSAEEYRGHAKPDEKGMVAKEQVSMDAGEDHEDVSIQGG